MISHNSSDVATRTDGVHGVERETWRPVSYAKTFDFLLRSNILFFDLRTP